MTHAVEVEHVSKTFRIPLDRAATLKYRVTHLLSSSRTRPFPALHDISFNVRAGEFLGIIGHNGSGKSTLLKILSHIYHPEQGEVRVAGRVSPFLELGVGFNPELTARENVFLNGAVLGIPRREMTAKVEGILEFAEVVDFSEMKLKNFSSGMQVRLAFSVAIEADADILLMDEVLAVGDARFAEKCMDVFSRYKRDGKTIILVTHDTGAVNAYCDRALLLDHGHLIADGRPDEVTSLYRRMALGDPGRADGGMGDESIPEPATDADDVVTEPVAGAVPAGPEKPAWLADGAERWGSRELEIRRLRLTDDAGSPLSSPITGSSVTLDLAVRVRQEVDGFVCLLGIYRGDGILIAGPNSLQEMGRVLVCPPAGSRVSIRYRIGHVPLLSAGYYVSAALYDRHSGHAYDHIERAFEFHVVDERVRVGLVDLGGRFELGEPETTIASGGASPDTGSAAERHNGEASRPLLGADRR